MDVQQFMKNACISLKKFCSSLYQNPQTVSTEVVGW